MMGMEEKYSKKCKVGGQKNHWCFERSNKSLNRKGLISLRYQEAMNNYDRTNVL